MWIIKAFEAALSCYLQRLQFCFHFVLFALVGIYGKTQPHTNRSRNALDRIYGNTLLHANRARIALVGIYGNTLLHTNRTLIFFTTLRFCCNVYSRDFFLFSNILIFNSVFALGTLFRQPQQTNSATNNNDSLYFQTILCYVGHVQQMFFFIFPAALLKVLPFKI